MLNTKLTFISVSKVILMLKFKFKGRVLNIVLKIRKQRAKIISNDT